jgi:hypothetical protein
LLTKLGLYLGEVVINTRREEDPRVIPVNLSYARSPDPGMDLLPRSMHTELREHVGDRSRSCSDPG